MGKIAFASFDNPLNVKKKYSSTTEIILKFKRNYTQMSKRKPQNANNKIMSKKFIKTLHVTKITNISKITQQSTKKVKKKK